LRLTACLLWRHAEGHDACNGQVSPADQRNREADCRRSTFNEIAEKFYEAGVIGKPESPYGSYPGTKRDYVHQKLQEAPDLEVFLRTTIPEVVYECDIEGPSVTKAAFLMEKLGYYKDSHDEAAQHGIASYTAPRDFPPELRSMSGASKPPPGVAIQIPDLPNEIQELVDALNGCLDHGYKNAAALLVRKIIHHAVFIAMARHGKQNLLKTQTGDDVRGFTFTVASINCVVRLAFVRNSSCRRTRDHDAGRR
jgi:hypothetical protein